MRVAIVEDETPAAEKLTRYLLRYDASIQIISTLPSVQQAIEWLKDNQEEIDIIFMDIQLTDGKSFEIFNAIEINKPVIFTTAFDEYALDAFKVNSINYLLKPITFQDIEATMQKIKALRMQLTPPGPKIKEVFSQGEFKSYKSRFMVKYGDHIRSIPTTDISIFFAEGRDVYLVTKNERKYILDYTLETLAGMLDPAQYFRLNRSIIVNIEAIKDVVVYSSSRLKITLHQSFDKEMVVSREKVQAFKDWFDS
jgi:DNA-binding LytR/AlgR family response regulator